MSGVCNAQQIFERIIGRVQERRIPFWAHLDVTYRCNVSCVHCYCQHLGSEGNNRACELTLSEIIRLFDELKDAGTLYLTISGGEVLVRPDFIDILREARARHFAVQVFTNGTLVTAELCQEMRALAVYAVELSIYGTSAEVHDAVTRVPGSFDRVAQACALLKDFELPFILKSVIMEQNFRQARDLEALSALWGAREFRYTLEVSARNDGNRLPLAYQLSPSRIHQWVSAHAPYPEPDPADLVHQPRCGSGEIGCYIDPFGTVYPCIQFLKPMGNIRTRSFNSIWSGDSPARQALNDVRELFDVARCKLCRYARYCRKCVGIAMLETGDVNECYGTLRTLAEAQYAAMTQSMR